MIDITENLKKLVSDHPIKKVVYEQTEPHFAEVCKERKKE